MITIEVNGKPTKVDASATVVDLLNEMNLGQTPVAVERNKRIVPRNQHATERLADGDTIEVVTFVGGG